MRLAGKLICGITVLFAMLPVMAAEYLIDSKGMHAFVQFRVKHLGYSWLYGRFNDFSGSFEFDEENPDQSSINVEIAASSVDTNHAERDKHLRSEDFLDANQYPNISFKSTSYTPPDDQNTAVLTGDLTLHGVTQQVEILVEHIGGGDDPWGGYRNGFEGITTIQPQEFGIDMVGQLGPAAATVEIMLSVEGVRQ